MPLFGRKINEPLRFENKIVIKNPFVKFDAFSRKNGSLIFLQTGVLRNESVKNKFKFLNMIQIKSI